MSAYLALSAISALAGFGLLTRLRLSVGPIHRWYLAPGATMLVWAIALGVGVSLGFSVRDLSGPLLALSTVVAILGVVDARRTWAAAKPTGLLIVVALPLAVMAMDVARGLSQYIGGPAQDGWSYVAFGQYLWEWPKGTEGGLAPLYQYASHLSKTRFISSAMLAFFSPTTGAGGDTQAAAGVFVAWALFVFGASCAGSAVALGIRRGWLALFTASAVMSPWVYAAVQIHNYDNLMALSFLPVAMSVVAAAERPGTSVAVLLGAVLAATVYTYPEVGVFVGLGVALAVVCRVTLDRRWLAWGKTCLLAGSLAALLLIPGRADLAWFISSQLHAMTSAVGARAGEGNFPYLLDFAKWPVAFWGLQTEPSSSPQTAVALATRDVIAGALWILSAVGIVALLGRRRWDVVLLGLGLSAVAVLLAARQHYAYGAYKLLLFGNWAMVAAVTVGAEVIAARLAASAAGRAVRVTAAATGALLAIAFFGSFALRERDFHQRLDPPTVAPFRVLTEASAAIGSTPVLVSVDNEVANAWAVYFLRDRRIRLLDVRGYMAQAHVKPLMDRTAPVDITTDAQVLSDDGRAAGREVTWQSGRFVLWRIPRSGAAFLTGVANPNGTERLHGRPFYWIGQGDTVLDVVATVDGAAALSASFIRGPSAPNSPYRRLRIAAASGESRIFTIVRDGIQSLMVPVHRGANRLAVRALDTPSTTMARDPRPLLVGIEGLVVSIGAEPGAEVISPETAQNPTCSTAFASGWHVQEATGSGWLRWSSGSGRLQISTASEADFELSGDVLSFVRPNTIDVRIDGRTSTTWTVTDPAWGFHAVPPVRFHVAAGRTVTVDLVGRARSAVSPSDPRQLAIAVRDLTVRRLDQPQPCALRF